MRTFTDDIRYSFLPRYGALAQIILINVGIFLFLGIIGLFFFFNKNYESFELFIRNYLCLSSHVSKLLFHPWTLIVAGFLHFPTDFGHILYNMLWLYWIGMIMVQFISERDKHIWSIYIGGVILGNLFYFLTVNLMPFLYGKQDEYFALGASAGVTAIVVGTAVLVPHATINLFLIGRIQIKWIALFFVVMDFVMLPAGNSGGHFAHLGGALFGYLYISQLQKGNDWGIVYEKITGIFQPRPKPRMRVVANRMAEQSRPTASSSSATTSVKSSAPAKPGIPSEQEIDRILDKIQMVGYENLTTEEKQTLYNAGKE